MKQKGILCFCKGHEDRPYLVISRESQADDETKESWVQVFETRPDDDNPTLFLEIKKIKIKLQRLCFGNRKLPLRFAFYSYINDEKRLLYGFFDSTIEAIQKGLGQTFDLLDNKGSSNGTISFPQFEVVEQQSFIEFLKDGWFMNMSVAVDFTASNGELHHLSDDPSVLNDYETSILEVGKVLEPYAYRSKFAGFGFGGIPRYQNMLKVNHCFNLNGKLDPTITGLDEMLNEYRRAVRGTEMWGPTLFAPMLRKIREFTDFNTTRMYYVLLILTDGCIHDMRETIDQIVECSS